MKLIKFKSDLIPIEPSKVSFGSIYGGAGFPTLSACWAGLNVKWCIEPRSSFSIKTFRSNYKDILYSTELEAFYHFPVDVIWGSPSCGEISSSGRNAKNAKKMQTKEFEDFEYTQYVMEIVKRRPKVFILENIPSVKNFITFTSTPAGSILKHQITKQEIPLYDYYIEEHRIVPTEIGVPQVRDRLFTIGSRLPYKFLLTPTEKDERKTMSIRSIFEQLDELRAAGVELLNDTFPKHSDEKIEKMERIRPGEGIYGGMNNKRLDPDKPSPVIMSSSTRYIHPWENRLITARESASLMGLPLDYMFYGSENKVLDQIGKAIVPQVGTYILAQVKDYLEKTKL